MRFGDVAAGHPIEFDARGRRSVSRSLRMFLRLREERLGEEVIECPVALIDQWNWVSVRLSQGDCRASATPLPAGT